MEAMKKHRPEAFSKWLKVRAATTKRRGARTGMNQTVFLNMVLAFSAGNLKWETKSPSSRFKLRIRAPIKTKMAT